MTSTRTLKQRTRELTKDGGPLDLGAQRSRFLVRLIREVARGRPVSDKGVAGIIAELGLDPGEAHDFLEQVTERNAEGNVVGVGISLNETPHRFTTNDAELYAWCAMDTLELPIVLNSAGHVESKSPVSSKTITLDATPEGVENISPAGAVISMPLVETQDVNLTSVEAIWGTFCLHSYFFLSRDEAERWIGDTENIPILSLDEGFDLAHDFAARFLAYEA